MVKIILYVISLAVLVTVAVWFADEPGRVTLEWLGYRIETSVAMLFVLVAVLLLTGTFLVRVWGTLIGASRAYRDARKDKRTDRGLKSLAVGFAAVRGGDVTAAQKASRDAATTFPDHDVARLLEQQTARVLGDTKSAAASARELLSDPTTELAALRDLTETAKAAGDLEGALAHAMRALDRKSAPRWAVSSALDLQTALGKWEALVATLERKDASSVINVSDQPQLKAEACVRTGAKFLADHDPATAIKWARKGLSADPSRTDAAAILARAMAADGKVKKAAAELERAWTAYPHPSLLSAYLQLAPGEAALARAGRLEKLVAGNPDHPESRLAQAEGALNAELWGQARSRLEPLLDKGTPATTRSKAAALMAQVEIGESGDTKAATQCLVIALEGRSSSKDLPAPKSIADLLSHRG
ncbi:MAG: hypothetical protein GKS03_16845 [Alphaproteobacteria bacterium]|nr:hypothetical protein [Alphaproteobacteria bacterium]